MDNTIYLVKVKHLWNTSASLPEILGRFKRRSEAEAAMKARIARTPAHVRDGADLRVLGPIQYKRLVADIKSQQVTNRKKGAQKAAVERKKNGTKPHFILCPTCNSRSKKLYSEMGGFQTRRCKRGHNFEVDTFFGFETSKRRVERTDRPIIVDGSYTDYIEGKYKDDPNGEQDK